MPAKQSNVRKLKTQPPTLTIDEVQRLSEKLAMVLEYDSNSIALLTLLFDYLEQQRCDPIMLSCSIGMIKDHLFARTAEAGEAQKVFQAAAYENRGRLLLWPGERKEPA